MEHTEECKMAQAKANAAITKYYEQWPNHCETCDGWGYHVQRGDMVPYGSTWVSLPDNMEPCICIEEGKCPRCGEKTIDPDPELGLEDVPCSACGWTSKTDGKPYEYDGCYCWDVYHDENEDL